MSEIKKLPVAEQAAIRKTLYGLALDGIETAGYETEAISEGSLIHLPDGQFALVKITVKDPEKFDLTSAREDYAAKQAAAAERSAAQAKKAQEKAAKDAEKAKKAKEKAEAPAETAESVE